MNTFRGKSIQRSMRVVSWVICLSLGSALSGGSALGNAQGAAPSEVIKERVDNFRKIGKAFKRIRDGLRTQETPVTTFQESAAQIESLGSQILSWFPPGTDTGQTHAKGAVWSEHASFEEAQKTFYAQAQRMRQVAQSGDRAALASQYRALGRSCKNCHDTFRGKVDDIL
jgi:cytochrome c556